LCHSKTVKCLTIWYVSQYAVLHFATHQLSNRH
jgi:hypothetical protein